jgi:hypothetical protein
MTKNDKSSKEASFSQVPTSNSSRPRGLGGGVYERTPIVASISNSENHDILFEESTTQYHSTTNTIENDVAHTKRCFGMKQTSVSHSSAESGNFLKYQTTSGGEQTRSSRHFQKCIKELMAFKAKFGHCNVPSLTAVHRRNNEKNLASLARWCDKQRRTRRLMEEGKAPEPLLTKAQIEVMDGIGFQWVKEKENSFEKHVKELQTFKAKFGHCNVTQIKPNKNRQYLNLAQWCYKVRRTRKLQKEGREKSRYTYEWLSEAQIESLDNIGFVWENDRQDSLLTQCFEKKIEQLKAYKAKFGHCMVTQTKSVENMPYAALGQWCGRMKRARRRIEEGLAPANRLSKDQIEMLESIGFSWE